MRSSAILIAALSLLLPLVVVGAQQETSARPIPPPPVTTHPDTSRIGGLNRFDTAALIAQETFPTAAEVIVAAGGNFPDALAASTLAGLMGAPVLLVNTDSVPPETDAALRAYAPTTIWLLGGTAAVSDAVAEELSTVATVQRLAGPTRFHTAATVAEFSSQPGGGLLDGLPTAIVANGGSFAEVLAAGPIAYAGRIPILLATTDDVPDVTVEALEDLGIRQVLLPGGPALLGSPVEAELDGVVDVVRRVGGDDPADTAAAFADLAVQAFGFDGDALLASAEKFPDGLSGGAAGGATRSVVLLTDAEPDPVTVDWLERNGSAVTALGGVAAVSAYALEAAAPGVEPQLTRLAALGEGLALEFDNPRAAGLQGFTVRSDASAIQVTAWDGPARAVDPGTADPNWWRPGITMSVRQDHATGEVLAHTGDGNAIYLVPVETGYVVEAANRFGVMEVRHVADTTFSEAGSTATRGTVAPSPVASFADNGEATPNLVEVPISRSVVQVTLEPRFCDGPLCEEAAATAVGLLNPEVACESASPGAHCRVEALRNGDTLTLVVTHYARVEDASVTPAEFSDFCEDSGGLIAELEGPVEDAGVVSSLVGVVASLAGVGWLSDAATYIGGAATAFSLATSDGERQSVRCQTPEAEAEALTLAGINPNTPVDMIVTLGTPTVVSASTETLGPITITPYQPFYPDGTVVADETIDVDLQAQRCTIRGPVPIDYRPRLEIREFNLSQRGSDTNCTRPDDDPDEPPQPATGDYLPIIAEGTGTGGNGIYSVRTITAVESGDLRNCDFRHGGICSQAPGSETADITVLSQAGMTVPEATTTVCERFDAGSFGSPPLAAGYTASIGGTVHTVDDWGSLDIGLCQQIVNG